ncbi:MAG: DUF4912 domain-containing protein [Clostridiaceae bacterium]|nr:DUF4912 domain-containing protein [Clostridiaceae bacterium]
MGIANKTSLVLLVQNPYTIFCYFNLENSIVKVFEEKYGFHAWDLSKPILKVYSIENGGIKELQTIFLDLKADNCYINLERDNLNLFVSLGRLLSADSFIPITVSNRVTTGRSSAVREDSSISEYEFFNQIAENIKKLGSVSSR